MSPGAPSEESEFALGTFGPLRAGYPRFLSTQDCLRLGQKPSVAGLTFYYSTGMTIVTVDKLSVVGNLVANCTELSKVMALTACRLYLKPRRLVDSQIQETDNQAVSHEDAGGSVSGVEIAGGVLHG